jgi:hypothetical protein
LNNISVHGGEDATSNNIRNATDSSIKNKYQINHELNVFDKLISSKFNTKDLMNDVPDNELRNSSINNKNKENKPTLVTLASIYGGKKNRDIKHDGLKVLIDTGCSDSIAHYKYSMRKINVRNFVYFLAFCNTR